MLDAQTAPWLVLLVGVFLFTLFYIRAFFTWIGGSWYMQKDSSSPIQEIKLRQLGPFVWGKTHVEGGVLLYRGWFNGKSLSLRRKDHGKAYFEKMGFPNAVIKELDGSEMAKMKMVFNASTGSLEGSHYPQKIEISRTRPPKILERGYLPATPRTWTRNPKIFNQS